MNVPAGGVDWEWLLSPQHATVLSVLTPQAKTVFGLTAAKVPAGGEDSP
jgi:hypothetical protein